MKLSSKLYCDIKASGYRLEHCLYDGLFLSRLIYTQSLLDCDFTDALNTVLYQIYDPEKSFSALPTDDKSGILLMTSMSNKNLEGMIYFGPHVEDKKNQFYPTPTGPGSILEIKLLAIAPTAKRKGLGTKLVSCVVDMARYNNIHSIILRSACDDSSAFYEKNNFSLIGDSDYYYPGRILFCDRPHSKILTLMGGGSADDFVDIPSANRSDYI